MRFLSRLGKERSGISGGSRTPSRKGALHYDSVVVMDSKTAPGVKFAIHRISFGRRMELSRRVREISRKAEFLAGKYGTKRENRGQHPGAGNRRDVLTVGAGESGGIHDRRRACHGCPVTGKGSGRSSARGCGRHQGTVRVERSRKKKLIVAFHFQLGNKAAWSCDPCRKSGLEKKRRCGWLANIPIHFQRLSGSVEKYRSRLVRHRTSHPESLALLEEFHAWKLLARVALTNLPARLVEAIFVLENELRTATTMARSKWEDLLPASSAGSASRSDLLGQLAASTGEQYWRRGGRLHRSGLTESGNSDVTEQLTSLTTQITSLSSIQQSQISALQDNTQAVRRTPRRRQAADLLLAARWRALRRVSWAVV